MHSQQLHLPLQLDPLAASSGPTGRSSPSRRSNGSMNKLEPNDAPAHDWFRFVLSFPPHLVRAYLEKLDVRPNHVVLDPFCGTGTTLVECKKLGFASVGFEAHPLAHFAASTKTDWSPPPPALLSHASRIADAAAKVLATQGIDDIPVLKRQALDQLELLALPEESAKLLLKNSLSPLPLHKTLVLLQCLNNSPDPRFARHEKLALANALVGTIGNLHFGPEVGIGQIKHDAPVIAPWLDRVRSIASHLEGLRDRAATPTTVLLSDSRDSHEGLPPQSIDAVFTSPPYPNEKDYTRTTRLESVLLGFIANRDDLRAVKRGLLRSNTRGVYKTDKDDTWIAQFPEITKLADEIETRRRKLGKTSGFERTYHRVTLLYFGGMARHLASLRPLLRPGAKLGYVVGDQASYLQVMIRTGQLLAKIASTLGYEVVGTDLFRTRLATATKQQLREEVLLLRWPG